MRIPSGTRIQSGNRITSGLRRNARGELIFARVGVPRGIALSGMEFGSNPTLPSHQYFKNKGFQTERVAYKWEDVQRTLDGPLDFQALDAQVGFAKTAGIKVVFDMHNYGGRIIYGPGGWTFDGANPVGQTTFKLPYSDSNVGAGTLTFRDYGRGIAGTADNGPGVITVHGKIDSFTNLYDELQISGFYKDENNNYTFYWNPSDGNWFLRKKINGVETQLKTGNKAVVLGQYYTIVMDMGEGTANKLNMTIDGVDLYAPDSAALDAALMTGYVSIQPNDTRFTIDDGDTTFSVGGDITSGNSSYHTVGDGTLTTDHIKNYYRAFAAHFALETTVYGIDGMNEPHDMTVPANPSNYKTCSTTLMMQAIIDGVRLGEADAGITDNALKKWLYCGFDQYSGAQNFVNNYGTNPDPFLTDPANKLVYSFHYYFDDNHEGFYVSAFKSSNNTRIPAEVLPVMQWGQLRGVNIGCQEYGVPNLAEWQICLTTFLDFCNQYNIETNHWAGGDGYVSASTLQPTSNFTIDRLQMAVVGAAKYLGVLR